jgi:hypothetical protein
MKGPTNYTGMALPNQSAGALGEAMTGSSAALNTGAGYTGQAGGLFSQFGGMTPSDVSTQTLGNTDLTPYMNPFQTQVTDATMDEIRRQQNISDMGVRDQAMDARAFGGDRMQVQQSENTRNYDDLRARTLASLNSANFGNAQSMAQTDLARRLQADQGNQNMRYGMSQAGASGLSGLGTQGVSQGLTGLGNLANLGFGFGNQLSQNQLAAGALNRDIMQSIIDASKSQYSGWTGGPDAGLEAFMKSVLGPGSAGTTKTDTGIWGTIGGIAEGIGALLPW